MTDSKSERNKVFCWLLILALVAFAYRAVLHAFLIPVILPQDEDAIFSDIYLLTNLISNVSLITSIQVAVSNLKFLHEPPLAILPLSLLLKSGLSVFPIALYYNAFWSALSVIPFYLLCRTFTDTRNALLGVALFALSEASFYRTSSIATTEAVGIFFFTWAMLFYRKKRHLPLILAAFLGYLTHTLPFVILVGFLIVSSLRQIMRTKGDKRIFSLLAIGFLLGTGGYVVLFLKPNFLEHLNRFSGILEHLNVKNFFVYSLKDFSRIVPVFLSSEILFLCIISRKVFWKSKPSFLVGFWVTLGLMAFVFMCARTLHLSVYRLLVYVSFLLNIEFAILLESFRKKIIIIFVLVIISIPITYTIGSERVLLTSVAPTVKEWEAMRWYVRTAPPPQSREDNWLMDSAQLRLLQLAFAMDYKVDKSEIIKLTPDPAMKLSRVDKLSRIQQMLREKKVKAVRDSEESVDRNDGDGCHPGIAYAIYSKRNEQNSFFETITPGATQLQSIEIFGFSNPYERLRCFVKVYDNGEAAIYENQEFRFFFQAGPLAQLMKQSKK